VDTLALRVPSSAVSRGWQHRYCQPWL